MNKRCGWLILALAALPPLGARGRSVKVAIDAGRPRQTIDGFGTTMLSTFQGEVDTLTEAEKKISAEALLGAVRINMGNVDNYVAEHRRNDNEDPFAIDWFGFRRFSGGLLRQMFAGAVTTQQAKAFFPGKLNVSGTPWLRQLRESDYPRYLDECAELLLALVKAWQEDWGSPPAYLMPFNEPTSGNRELGRPPGDDADREMADILKRAGKRLSAAGYGDVRFVFPNQETIERSCQTAANVLADAEARKYIGRIGFHEYPYGSPLSSVKKVLCRADGSGNYGVVEERTRLKRIAQSYGIPLWMSEVSRGGIEYKRNGIDSDCRDFRLLRGRANHIHSEFVVTEASAFFAMNHTWSRRAHELHYKGRGGEDGEGAFSLESDTIFLADQKYGLMMISGVGYAIGHYARWLTPGHTVLVESASSDPHLRVSAFHDAKVGRYIVVLMNNDKQPQQVTVRLKGVKFKQRIGGEQSTASAYWEGLRPFSPAATDTVHITVPPNSVTTLVDGIAGQAPRRAPVVEAGAVQKLPPGSTSATLSGVARDPDGNLRWHSWVLESGPAPAIIGNRASLRTVVSALQSGEYVFRLYACDNEWRLGSATVRVVVGKAR